VQGSRRLLDEVGPERWAQALRERTSLAGHRHDAARRPPVAARHPPAHHRRPRRRPATAKLLPGLLSLEAWGGATYDVALRFLHEDPWQRLAALREAAPDVCLQMLLRGRNAVGYTPYPDRVVQVFVAEAAATGVDVFRVFDALNDLEQMRPALDAVREAARSPRARSATPATCRTRASGSTRSTTTCASPSSSSRPAPTCWPSRTWPGCCARPRPRRSSRRCAAASTCRSTCTPTTRPVASSRPCSLRATPASTRSTPPPRRCRRHQPAEHVALVAATDHTERSTGLSLTALSALEPYWEAVRDLYAPFEAGLRAPTGTVYRHEIPGGQLTNLRQQAIALGLGDRWEDVQELYAVANELLGKPIKVTPTSKVVGDLAIFLASGDVDVERLRDDPGAYDLPASVLGYLAGELGTPPAGFPEPFRTKAVAGRAEELPEVALDPATTPPSTGPSGGRSCRGCCSPARGRTTSRRSPSTATSR
jgi:pyruvate carboxylase